jgi:hypothetical protein
MMAILKLLQREADRVYAEWEKTKDGELMKRYLEIHDAMMEIIDEQLRQS